MLHEHVISVSYDRVLQVSAHLGDATVRQYEEGHSWPLNSWPNRFEKRAAYYIGLGQHRPQADSNISKYLVPRHQFFNLSTSFI